MSIKALTWARDVTVGSPTRKLVLMALADRANDEAGWVTWAGQDTIARECELSTRSVIRALAQLEDIGAITRRRRHRDDGTRTSDVIQLVPEWPGLPDTQSPDRESRDTQSCDNGRATYLTGCHDLPDRESPQEPEGEQEEEREVVASHPADALCDTLADAIAERGSKRPNVTDTWRHDMRRLIDLDGRTPDEIHKVIRWLSHGTDEVASFWQPNIRSPRKLRARWDQMAEQHHRRHKTTTTDRAWATSQAIIQAASNDSHPDIDSYIDAVTGGPR